MYDLMTLKENLLKKREAAGLTQAQLANEIGISRQTIIDLENSANPKAPDLRNIIKLCNYYDCDLDALFGNLDYSKHDRKYVCEYTGLSENTIREIKHLDLDAKELLESILDSGLLGSIWDYKLFDNPNGSAVDGYKFVIDPLHGDPKNIDWDFCEPYHGEIWINGLKITDSVCKQAILNRIGKELDALPCPGLKRSEEQQRKSWYPDTQYDREASSSDELPFN